MISFFPFPFLSKRAITQYSIASISLLLHYNSQIKNGTQPLFAFYFFNKHIDDILIFVVIFHILQFLHCKMPSITLHHIRTYSKL